MKGPFCVIVIGLCFVTTNGQCPSNVVNRSLLSSCEGMIKRGPAVFVDFYKISRPCTCIVTPSFDGDLLVLSREAVEIACNTEINFQIGIIFGCPTNVISSLVLNVKINQTVDVRARYVSPYTSGIFQHCIGFQQRGGLGGNLSVVCGSNHSAETTSMETSSTTTASYTTRLISTTPELSSVELITTSAINENISDATGSTAATLSEENKCDSLIAESLLSLQILLALFVMISTVSTILNIFFCRYIKTRKKFWNGKSNSKSIKDHRSRTASNAETYTELGNTVSGESENQYDSISRQDNYINPNVL